MKAVAVECIGIGLAYGANQVLKDITLAIEPGEFFALLGPSGSGKSTLLRLIAGFNQHNRGRLLVDGRDITGVPPHSRNIGMVFQSYALWPHMTVFDNVAFGLVERRVGSDEIKRRVGEALALVGLSDYARRRPSQLSGGQQQRVALARTIVIEPQVLLLDEPLSNLDKKLREQMRLELKRLQRKLGITTIFVTHDQEEAMTTADRMAVLDGGVLQQVGTPRELYDLPANRFVAEFVGTTNVLAGRGDPARRLFVAEGLGELPLEAAGEGKAVSIRPHALTIATERDDRFVWFDGEVVDSEFLGEFTRYEVRVGASVLTADVSHLSSTPIHPSGSRVQVGIDSAELRLLP
ncbi:MAG: ABC transporter ATP-binding protein [Burkholderiaceae bacterium]|jgi:iron(III) transport system ATP-binding protein|nr:ABC transporter ATP-binding protein [Burkholderiaceae bacterium]